MAKGVAFFGGSGTMESVPEPEVRGAPEAPAELVDDAPVLAPPAPAGLPAHLSLPRLVAALAIWPFLEQILGFLVGFVDTAIAGRLSVEATNAVGVATYVLWLMNVLIGAVGVGATALVARSAGAGRWPRANAVVGQAIVLALAWGTALGVLFFLGAPWIGRLSGLTGTSLALCEAYLRVLSLAAPFTAVLGIGAACLRGAGDTRTPFFIMVLVNAVNLTVCLLLAWPQSPWGTWNVIGIATAALCAWATGLVCILGVLLHGRFRLSLQRRYLGPRPYLIRRIVRVGLPNLLEGGGHWLGNYLVMIIVGHLPLAAAVGAHHVVVRLEAMSFLPGFSIGLAAATLTGQYLGARDPHTARRAVWWCWAYGAGLMTTLGLFFILFPSVFVRLVTDQPVFLETCPPLLFLAGWAQLGFGSALVFGSALRGAGDTGTAMRITYGSTFLLRLPLAYLLGVLCGYGLWGVWVGLCAELTVRGALFLTAFLRGGWTRVRV